MPVPIPDGRALELFDGSRWSPVKSSLAIGTGTPFDGTWEKRRPPEGKDLLIERQRRRRAGQGLASGRGRAAS